MTRVVRLIARPARRWRRIVIPFVALIAIFVFQSRPAAAHPLGNFSVNRYSRLEVSDGQIGVIYVVDMAEIPAFQERPGIDLNGDGSLSDGEQAQYLAGQAEALASNLSLTVDGRRLPLEIESQRLEFSPGQGGLETMRLTLELSALLNRLPASNGGWQAEYRDGNFDGRLGWQEVVVQGLSGVSLLESSVPTTDISQELRNYPQDLLQSPPAVNRATFRLTLGAAGVTASNRPAPVAETAGISLATQDRFAEVITQAIDTPGALFLALIASFGWGALHALTPGHGKTVVAAYLVGSRGTPRHALFLGLTTTITHTLGVFALGLIVLAASQFIVPEQLYPWLGVISGALVVIIGLTLLRQRAQVVFGSRHPHHHDHDHPHDHDHGHDHDGGNSHSHLPPGADGRPLTWRSLLALGISGGLLPCPSALVVMLSAIALQRVVLGLALIVVFSIGLASVLTGIGLLMVYAGRLVERQPASRGRVFAVVPVVSALFITLAGVGITWQALVQAGVIG